MATLSQLHFSVTSVQELEARIKDISADIERQPEKGVLQGLERDKSLLQRQLNAVRDPIQRLPLEISSEIFAQCLPEYPTLSDVRSIRPRAMPNPKLWSTINIQFPAHRAGLEVMVEKWLQRTRSNLLDVSMTGPLDTTVAALIWRHSSHLGHLKLFAVQDTLRPSDYSHVGSAVFWELLGVQTEPLPLLQFLEIHGRHAFGYSRRPILRFLSLSSNITELILEIALAGEDQEIDHVVIPNLRRLECGRDIMDRSHDYFQILSCIRAPRLESLTVEFPSTNDIVPFLQQLSSSLQELVIRDPGELALDQILSLVPTLIRLEFESPYIKCAGQLFKILAPPPPYDPSWAVVVGVGGSGNVASTVTISEQGWGLSCVLNAVVQ
ncbi:hypothetical protein FB45DRAFT_1125495 [Roridomyces roridus]|uniref:F-box domain-containing protein n=1 Tax=Roridomyces roridus TaxID=1738132 RepID=A0AAD7C832_9AGAR|nr:hypothetical protein FB45DRAFT_1125495 [Roridomyces roridus]